jgi:hopanoid-associated phosphorylase
VSERADRVLAVTGMAAEARIAAGAHVITVCGGGRSDRLAARIEEAIAGGVAGIVSFGIAGALDPRLRCGDCVIARAVVTADDRYLVDERWSDAIAAKVRHAARADVAGIDEIASEPSRKAALFDSTRAACADMESHVAARIARAHALPFAAIRVVSDSASRTLPDAALTALRPDGRVDVTKVMKSVLARPAQLPLLVQAGMDASRAFGALAAVRVLLGRRLGFPDFDQLPLDVL